MARGLNGQLEGGRELTYITQKDSYTGSLLRRIITSVNNLAKNAAVSSVGKLSPPHPVDGITVQGTMNSSTNTITCPSEHLHFTITHNQAIQKGVQYISEIATEPNFLQPHVVDHGSSRSGFVPLPANDSNGNPQTYYLLTYAQYHVSDPSQPTVVGGISGATKIVMTGSSKMTLLSSTGSGTAATNGMQGGKGLGTVLTRPAPGPKRNLV